MNNQHRHEATNEGRRAQELDALLAASKLSEAQLAAYECAVARQQHELDEALRSVLELPFGAPE